MIPDGVFLEDEVGKPPRTHTPERRRDRRRRQGRNAVTRWGQDGRYGAIMVRDLVVRLEVQAYAKKEHHMPHARSGSAQIHYIVYDHVDTLTRSEKVLASVMPFLANACRSAVPGPISFSDKGEEVR